MPHIDGDDQGYAGWKLARTEYLARLRMALAVDPLYRPDFSAVDRRIDELEPVASVHAELN